MKWLSSLQSLRKSPVFLFIAAQACFSSPVFYTFSGTITESPAPEFPVGSGVDYTFLVDFDRPGIYVHHAVAAVLDGTSYVEFVGALPILLGVPGSDKSYHLSSFAGAARLTGSDPYFHEHPGDPGLTTTIEIWSDFPLSDWIVGRDGFVGRSFPYGNVQSSLTLTSIADAPPAVPEPSTAMLLLMALPALGLAVRVRKAPLPA